MVWMTWQPSHHPHVRPHHGRSLAPAPALTAAAAPAAAPALAAPLRDAHPVRLVAAAAAGCVGVVVFAGLGGTAP